MLVIDRNTDPVNHVPPMPLKHTTETLLAVLLGLAFLLTGFVIAFLPPLKNGYAIWVIAFGASILYPLILFPLFRSRRADNSFRLLHFLPAVFLLLWFGLEASKPYVRNVAWAERIGSYAWGLPLVALGFLFLIVFCVRVLRQRNLRVSLLLLLLIPFAVLGIAAEQQGWNPVIASIAKQPSSWKIPGRFWVAGGPTAAQQSSEETWQMQLRRMLRRSDRLAGESGSDASSITSIAAAKAQRSQASSRRMVAKIVKTPTLPPSGMGTELAIPLMLAGYTSVVHQRAKRRVQEE